MRMAMIAITTNSSIRVNPRRGIGTRDIDLTTRHLRGMSLGRRVDNPPGSYTLAAGVNTGEVSLLPAEVLVVRRCMHGSYEPAGRRLEPAEL